MRTPENRSGSTSLGKSVLLQEIYDVTEKFYKNNPFFTTLKPPKAKDLGFRKTEQAEVPKSQSEAILKEMAAVLPMTSLCLYDYTHNPHHRQTFFKIGLVYANDPHTYLAVPAQRAVDEYRQAFEEYLPHRKWELDQVKHQFPNGLPVGRLVDYLPLHSTVWCFLEENGTIYPIDALSVFTARGYFDTLFLSDTDDQQHQLESKKRLRRDLFAVMNEYTHVAAVGMYHLYEDFLLDAFVEAIERNREKYNLSPEKWSVEKIKANFSQSRKGIRRYINIAHDPGDLELDDHPHLLEGSRDDGDNGRGPQSARSIHFFSREIPYKKLWRLFDKHMIETFLNTFAEAAEFTQAEYHQLDILIRDMLENTQAWLPPNDTRLFDFVPRSRFIAEDTDRFIKALDPYANWESPALLELMLEPLRVQLVPLGLDSIQTFSEPAESVQPYNRNISAITMKFSSNKIPPADIMVKIGDVLEEIYEAKKEVYQPGNTRFDYQLLPKDGIDAWQKKMSAYQPTRKSLDPTIDCRYMLNQETRVFIETIKENWNKKDIVALFSQFIAQWLLYHWTEMMDVVTTVDTTDPERLLEMLVESNYKDEDSALAQKWRIIQFALGDTELLRSIVVRTFRMLWSLVRKGQSGEIELAQYLVARTLENNRLGIIPKGQRTLNSTRLPGFLFSYDYINEGNGVPEYLQCMLSPIISERSSVEQNKGITVPRAADEIRN